MSNDEKNLQKNDFPLLHCKQFAAFVQKAIRDSCNCHRVLYEVRSEVYPLT